MGLFSRSEPSPKSGRRNSSRAPASSDAQAGDLRGRARRRLVGALVLVVAAIIILPMLFDKSSDTGKTPAVAQVVIPSPPQPNTAQPTDSAGDATSQETLPVPQAIQPDGSDDGKQPATESNPAAKASDQTDSQAGSKPESSKPEKPSDGASGAKPTEKREEPKASSKAAENKADSGSGKVKRTDDGSVALALLQGRSPKQAKSQPAAPEQGKYVLQIAAYTTDQDAQARRDRLIAAGVTNAYVERAISSGKPTYRLRVGPFPTRDAAQAAQARLRALGYDNGFISTK